MVEDVSFCFVDYLFSFFLDICVIFATCVKLLDYITLFTLVLLRPLGGVIFIVFNFYYSVLSFVPL
jgi:hypothetical protein